MNAPRWIIVFFSVWILISLAVDARAKPISVELYPNGAKVTERTLAPIQQDGNRFVARFAVPIHAAKDTLTVNASPESGMLATSIQMEIQKLGESDTLKALKNSLKELQGQKADIEARIKANTAYISFWENLGNNLPEKTDAINNLADSIRKSITEGSNQIFRLTQSLEPLNSKIDEVQKQIDQLSGQAETQWRVAVVLNKKTADVIDLMYSYVVGNCGWTPVYTFNAHPGKSEIEFVWYADVTQTTGVSWDNVDLTLATAQARPQPEPPVLQDWIIRPMQIYPQRKTALAPLAGQMRASVPGDAAGDLTGPETAEPRRWEGYAFDIYDLGRQTVFSGETQRIDIRKQNWKADFKYLVRPYESKGAFLFAQLVFSSAKEEFIKLPQGMAVFLIDSAMVSSREFSWVDPEEKLFFGSDPQVSVKMDVRAKKSGEKGFFAGKKTYTWGWNVTVHNLKVHDIDVLMEDAYPQLQDERIQIEESFSGITPEKENTLLKWRFAIKPKTKTEIQYGFSISYPEDLNLDFGGR